MAEYFGLQLTILSGVTRNNFRFRAPAQAVPALNFDLVGHKCGCVLHSKAVSFNHVFLPLIVHTQSPVAHPVLQAWTVVFYRHQRLKQENTLWV